MTAEQSMFAGSDLVVLVNVVDSTGNHASATIDTSLTRVDGFSTVPTVSTIGTGIYTITFSGLSPAPTEGDRLIVKVNGNVGSEPAWTEYGIPVIVNAAGFDAATETVDVGKISGNTTAASNLAASAATIISCAVDETTNSFTSTTTQFQTGELTEITSDHYVGRIVYFTSGALAGQAAAITAYEDATGIGQITVAAMTDAPTDGDTFIVI